MYSKLKNTMIKINNNKIVKVSGDIYIEANVIIKDGKNIIVIDNDTITVGDKVNTSDGVFTYKGKDKDGKFTLEETNKTFYVASRVIATEDNIPNNFNKKNGQYIELLCDIESECECVNKKNMRDCKNSSLDTFGDLICENKKSDFYISLDNNGHIKLRENVKV